MSNSYPTKKALSIRHPWAWLIVNGYKDIENRSWQTEYRGPFLVHAGKRFDKEGYLWVTKNFPEIQLPELEEFQMGGVIGAVDLVDCVSVSESRWFEGPYGFVLQNPRHLPFIPVNGKLGFFFVET